MNILKELQSRFRVVLAELVNDPAELARLVDMVRPAQDTAFGDYQANCAMPLGKKLGRNPRELAAALVARVQLDDLCQAPEVAGPGFINLRLKDEWIIAQLARALGDERLGVAPAAEPRTIVIDYSAPNVAKPMHVGHIRSTVIGAALDRVLRFLGHQVISDNHVGDWGTQFGMILYGFKHFVDAEAYGRQPVAELSRLYRLVNRLCDYHSGRRRLPQLGELIAEAARLVDELRAAPAPADRKAEKEAAKALQKAAQKLQELQGDLVLLEARLADVESDPSAMHFLHTHSNIEAAVLAQTALLHAGDPENRRLWKEFLPACMDEIERLYRRLEVKFDHTLGESFYHDRLAGVVADLERRGIARQSEGAVCVFNAGHDAPFIIRKQDGAFLYATTDLATIQYRVATWMPDTILYVVDSRQSQHFEQLFATAKLWGFDNVELVHVAFGTVLGSDGKPFKTRSGDTVGLDGLLNEAVERAASIVTANQISENPPDLIVDPDPNNEISRRAPDADFTGVVSAAHVEPDPGTMIEAMASQAKSVLKLRHPTMTQDERREVAEAIGIGAIKYADLSQNRTSDYVFSYDKMLAMTGNTATYMQYAYARASSIFHKAGVDPAALRQQAGAISIDQPAERALGLAILQFSEALDQVTADYRPNFLTAYLFELANRYSTFFEQCHVLRADSDALRNSRLRLCDLTARTIRQGLELLGIRVVEKM